MIPVHNLWIKEVLAIKCGTYIYVHVVPHTQNNCEICRSSVPITLQEKQILNTTHLETIQLCQIAIHTGSGLSYRIFSLHSTGLETPRDSPYAHPSVPLPPLLLLPILYLVVIYLFWPGALTHIHTEPESLRMCYKIPEWDVGEVTFMQGILRHFKS